MSYTIIHQFKNVSFSLRLPETKAPSFVICNHIEDWMIVAKCRFDVVVDRWGRTISGWYNPKKDGDKAIFAEQLKSLASYLEKQLTVSKLAFSLGEVNLANNVIITMSLVDGDDHFSSIDVSDWLEKDSGWEHVLYSRQNTQLCGRVIDGDRWDRSDEGVINENGVTSTISDLDPDTIIPFLSALAAAFGQPYFSVQIFDEVLVFKADPVQ